MRVFKVMEPVNIGGAFGWLGAGRTGRAVVLCGTWGHEQHAAHRWWRDLGEGLAAAGCTVLRFDYQGEGDSEGGSVALDTALDAIRRAVRFMREEARAEEIVLVGLRFGGTLAALVAGEGGIDRLVLLAPFARGRAYLREMAVQARVIDILPDGSPLPKPEGVLSVAGFRFDPALTEAVAPLDLPRDLPLDLPRADRAPAPRILLLGPDPADLSAVYAAAGASVQTGPLPDLASLVSDAEHPRLDAATRERIVAFVGEGAPSRSVRPPPLAAVQTALAGPDWIEEPASFGGGLFGIGCRPRSAPPGSPAVLFVNMGVNVHSGYGRQTTNLARALARNGVGSLRMDLRGAGDSIDRPDGGLPLYRHDALADIRAAVDELIRSGAGPIIVTGTCNGAYLGFHALCEDPRIAAAILVNPYCFDWELTHGGVPYGGTPVRHAAAYAALLRDGAVWRRIFAGETPVRAILAALARRGLARLRRPAQPPPQVPPIAARVAALRRRGAKLVLLYSAGDLGLIDLRLHLGPPDRASDILGERVHVVAGADHSFSAPPAQALLLRELDRMATACAADRPATAANDIASDSLDAIRYGRTLGAA